MPQVYRAIRPMFKRNKWRICRDDMVQILRGPERGQIGKVLEVIKDTKVPQVIVEGKNLRKKKVPEGRDPDKDFFVVTMEAPMHYSAVRYVDPNTKTPARVMYKYDDDGNLIRCVRNPDATFSVLPSPKEDQKGSDLAGPRDTPMDVVQKVTYDPTAEFPFRMRAMEKLWAKTHGKHVVWTSSREDEDDEEGEQTSELASTSGEGPVEGGSAARALPGTSRGRALFPVAFASTARIPGRPPGDLGRRGFACSALPCLRGHMR